MHPFIARRPLRLLLVLGAALVAAACADRPSTSVRSAPAVVRIHDIQSRAHRSPFDGKTVDGVEGVVTALAGNGFYLEDPLPDNDPATSEGIFVYTDAPPTVTVGRSVRVAGRVGEYRPGGAAGTENLTVTQITSPTVTDAGTAPAPLPPPAVIGARGRLPPLGRIAGAPAGGSVEGAGHAFDPDTNAIDFYESLEGMRVVVEDAVVVGPTTARREIVVVPDGGASARLRSARGGVVVGPGDFNPQRLLLGATLIGASKMPQADVGDRLAPVQGVVDYGFGNFRLLLGTPPVRRAGAIARETTVLKGDASHLTIASFNVENLAPTDRPAKFATLGRRIAVHLGGPDIVALMEIQDDNGAVDDATVEAAATLRTLVSAIRQAGGPTYAWRQIDPVAGRDGGQPGGNIRQVLLFNPARVAFVDRAGPKPATTAVTVVKAGAGVHLSASPGRIAPTDDAFADSRKPLVGEFRFAGRTLFVVANHFNSKGGDAPLFGRLQPPPLPSETQRLRQATLVAGFVRSLAAADPEARVAVLGDLNDFPFSAAVATLKAAGLVDLVETLAPAERYTYVYEGNSQVLDHILVNAALARAAEYDVVHVDAEFADQASDHDPEVARLAFARGR